MSKLPSDKTPETLDMAPLPAKVRRQVQALYEGRFVDEAENVLAFGLPGRGKTHCLCAVGHELVRRGVPVLFVPAYRLVQSLLQAKRDLVAVPAFAEAVQLEVHGAVLLVWRGLMARICVFLKR
jgi:DNA replication protein DnaC